MLGGEGVKSEVVQGPFLIFFWTLPEGLFGTQSQETLHKVTDPECRDKSCHSFQSYVIDHVTQLSE